MISIKSYILNPSHVRGGENVLNTITSFGGYKSNITINNDGSGTIVYNNSDYIVSLSNDLLVDTTSYFTISNVSNSDTVGLYEDDVLISTTTGNTVAYTPTTAGEHEIYFRVNSVSTNTINVNVYTLTSTTINISPVNGVAYFKANGNITFTVKPNLLEDVTANNIPCTITYGSRTYHLVVSNLGTQVTIAPLLTSSSNTNALTITCAGEVYTYNIQEYFSYYKNISHYDLPNLQADEGIRQTLSDSNLIFNNITNSNRYIKFTEENIPPLDTRLIFQMQIIPGSGFVQIVNSEKNSSVSVGPGEIIVITIKQGSKYINKVYEDGQLVKNLESVSKTFYIGLPQSTQISIKNLVYGVS